MMRTKKSQVGVSDIGNAGQKKRFTLWKAAGWHRGCEVRECTKPGGYRGEERKVEANCLSCISGVRGRGWEREWLRDPATGGYLLWAVVFELGTGEFREHSVKGMS